MEIDEREVEYFVGEFRKHVDFNFSGYSRRSLGRRISKIMQDYQFENLDSFLQTLKQKPAIIPKIIEKITVNTTELYRDPPLWEYLYFHVFNQFFDHEIIKTWHLACSSGEEVYSALGLFHQLGILQIVHSTGTDLNNRILETARKGIYTYRFHQKYVKNLEAVDHMIAPAGDNTGESERLRNLFRVNLLADEIETDTRLKERAVFEVFDVTNPDRGVVDEVDILFCRNLLIYFNDEYQQKILKHLYNHLKPGGYLILGKHEVMSEAMKKLFVTLKHQVYKKKDTKQ